MVRGAVVVLVVRGEAGKPRPAVVVQSDLPALGGLSTLLVVPCTSELDGAPLRPRLSPSAANGLHQPSAAMVDRLQAVDRNRIKSVLGALSPADMTRVEAALTVVLGL